MNSPYFSKEYLEKIKKLEDAAAGIFAVPNNGFKNQDEVTKTAINELKKRNKIEMKN